MKRSSAYSTHTQRSRTVNNNDLFSFRSHIAHNSNNLFFISPLFVYTSSVTKNM